MILSVEGLRKHFVAGGALERLLGKTSVVKAVDGVSFGVEAGRTLGIVGESGSGKTTLARTIARLYKPTEGRIVFNDRDITNLSEADLRPLRRNIQMIFQDPLASLNPRRSVGQIVEKPLSVHRIDGDRRQRVDESLTAVGLDPRRHRDRYPYQLSGGQAQRVAIARSLIIDPELIVADEPVSALDVSVQAQIINLMRQLQEERGLTYLFISHDLSVVRHLTDHVMVMFLGRAVELAPTDELFADPMHPYTKMLLDAVPRVHARSALDDVVARASQPFKTRREADEAPLVEARPGHFVAQVDD